MISVLACIIILRQQLDDRNGVAALDALMILLATLGCLKVLFRGYFLVVLLGLPFYKIPTKILRKLYVGCMFG